MRAWIAALLVTVSLILSPLHAVADVAPGTHAAAALAAPHGGDQPCDSHRHAHANRHAAACCMSGGGCALALSPPSDSAPIAVRGDVAAVAPMNGFASRDQAPALPPPRTLDA